MYQQGNVIFEPLSAMPAAAQPVPRGPRGIVLAEGEATGHAHVVLDEEARAFRDESDLLLSLSREATVTHEEHGPITLPPGIYRVRRVREYDHFVEEAKPVQD